jgi:hypothetical protein
MWVLAPEWPAHAHHVAVEFVHPVIVGTRALPAAMVEDPDPVAALRAATRPGDVLLAVARGQDRVVGAAMRRAPAWGLETFWLGAGPPPSPGSADHVLWLPDDEGVAAHAGRLVLVYHVLWELTHVCFEHPGLLGALVEACEGPGCATCADEGRLAEVAAAAEGVATVRPGDLVLVHGGVAISVVRDEEGGAR